MTAFTVYHRAYRNDSPGGAPSDRCVGVLPDGQVGLATLLEGADQAELEFAFPLADAQFYAERILAGDMGAARKPGMSRLLAATVIVLLKAGMAGGVLAEKPDVPDDGAPS